MDTEIDTIEKKKYGGSKFLNAFFVVCFVCIFSYYTFSAPTYNPSLANRQPTIVHIAPGESLKTLSVELENRNIVRYAYALRAFIILFKSDKQIARGDYLFKQNVPVWSIAWQIARGRHDINPIKVTFKEGITVNDMASLLALKLSGFRRDLFLSDPRTKEGYLFPDTYFFFSLATAGEIVDELSNNFDRHITQLAGDIKASGYTTNDIITMASIIEKEANGKDDAPTISGILWKRLKNGMLLQVDAVPSTYKIVGLPKNPVNNPGLVSLQASLHPVDSPYVFYLHDKSGVAHFAKTFEEHKNNINRYLR